MKMPKTVNIWLLLAVLSALSPKVLANSDWLTPGPISKVQPLPDGIEVKSSDTLLRIAVLSPTVVRVRYTRSGQYHSAGSFAVVSAPGFHGAAPKVRENTSAVELDTGQLIVRILKRTMRVLFVTPDGQPVLEDAENNAVTWAGSEFRVCKTMPDDEHYFGLGDKAGSLDHRNQSFTMWNADAFGWQESTDPLYKTIPFFLALRQGKSYGLFLDNPYRSNFDFGKAERNKYCFSAEGGDLNYYFFYGPDPKNVVEQYTALTGRPPLPPLFAFGYQQSRYSYVPETQVRAIAAEFRRKQIPADVIYLDIDYQDGNRPFTVDHSKFPHFEEMIHDLGEQGFKVVAVTDPHLKHEAGYQPYDEAVANDYLVHNPDGSVYVGEVWPGESVFPDFVRADVRIWWGTLYANFVKVGIRGFWNDMNEPAIFPSRVNTSKTMPLDTVHHVDGRTADHREIHNVFGMQNARATYEGLLRLRPNVRPFVLTRAAYAGTQRFALSWTGDNSSTWNHLRLSIPMLLNLGISGYSFVGDDIGGFNGSPGPRLLTRWMEAGAFNPLYRNHANKGTQDREPWAQGSEQEEIRRRFIQARYRLLPYIYTTAEQATRTGIPLMRAMFMEFPDDSALTTLDGQYMFGGDLLVAPKVIENTDPYNVVLPKGTWFDYWTGIKIDGGKSITVNPRLDEVPVYVRAGSIIPHQPIVQNVDELPNGPLELQVYPGPNCRGSIYIDDGNSLDFTRGAYLRMSSSCTALDDSTLVHIDPATGDFKPWWHQIRIVVMSIANAPCEVKINGVVAPDWKYAGNNVSVVIPAPASSLDMLVSYKRPC